MRPDEEQRPSLESSPGFCFNQRCLTDIYQVREGRYDRGRSYTTEYFWGDSSNTISYSNVRGMDYNQHMNTWLILFPYLIANCQTQSYFEVVRDKMQRLKLQEWDVTLYARLEKSFTVQLRTSLDVGSAQVVPARSIGQSASRLSTAYAGQTLDCTSTVENVEDSKVGEETSTALFKKDGHFESYRKVTGENGASSSMPPRSPRIGRGIAHSTGDKTSAQLSHNILTGSLIVGRRGVERRRRSLPEFDGLKLQREIVAAGLSPASGEGRRSIVSDDGSSVIDYQYESETDEGSVGTSDTGAGDHQKHTNTGITVGKNISGEHSHIGNNDGNDGQESGEDAIDYKDAETSEIHGPNFDPKHDLDEVSLLSTSSLKAGSIDLSARSMHSDHKSIGSDAQTPEALILEDLKSEQDVRISELSRALNIHRKDASAVLIYFDWDESRVMEAWENPAKMPEVRSFLLESHHQRHLEETMSVTHVISASISQSNSHEL